MLQTVSRLPIIAEARDPSQAGPLEIYSGQNGTVTGFSSDCVGCSLPVPFDVCSIPQPSSARLSYRNKRSKPGSLPKSSDASEIGERRMESLFFVFKGTRYFISWWMVVRYMALKWDNVTPLLCKH
jgi:hypothetical protein